MKLFLIFGVLALVSGALALFGSNRSAPPQPAETEAVTPSFPPASRQPVVVVLFTSVGCSSCAPADKVLSQLAGASNADADVITLSLHVDYWDSPGWKDPFSSLAFSRRQDIYSAALRGENYTPQMIVDGREAFVGSDSERAQKAIANAAKAAKAKIEIVQDTGKIKIKIADVPAHENATVFFAVTEDNLASSVRGGENSGRNLAHTSVVRDLKSLGMISAQQKDLQLETAVEIKPDWKRNDLKLVVFVQENQTRKIFGAGAVRLSN